MVYHGPSGGCKVCRARRVKVAVLSSSSMVVHILMVFSAIGPSPCVRTVFVKDTRVQAMATYLIAPTDLKIASFGNHVEASTRLQADNMQALASQIEGVDPH